MVFFKHFISVESIFLNNLFQFLNERTVQYYPFPSLLLQQICRTDDFQIIWRKIWKIFRIEMKTLCQEEKVLMVSNFFFCQCFQLFSVII